MSLRGLWRSLVYLMCWVVCLWVGVWGIIAANTSYFGCILAVCCWLPFICGCPKMPWHFIYLPLVLALLGLRPCHQPQARLVNCLACVFWRLCLVWRCLATKLVDFWVHIWADLPLMCLAIILICGMPTWRLPCWQHSATYPFMNPKYSKIKPPKMFGWISVVKFKE